MKQGEEHDVERGKPGPAVVQQEGLELQQIIHLQQPAGGKIGHNNDRHHNFVGGKARIKARRMTPSSPKSWAKGSRKAEQRLSRVASPR